MATRVPSIISTIVTLATAAVPNDCEVLDSWQAATEHGKVLTIGVPDLSVSEVGGLTQPAVTVQRSDPLGMGRSPGQEELVQVLCSLEVPAGEDDSTPATVRSEAAVTLDALAAAVNAIADTQGAWLTENAWYQAALGAAGWGVTVLFTINVRSFIT